MKIFRGCCALFVVTGLVFVSATSGCGSDACSTGCEDAYDREVACDFFIDPGDREAAVKSCTQQLDNNGATDEQCSQAQDTIESSSCADLAASACSAVPESNQGSGCKTAT